MSDKFIVQIIAMVLTLLGLISINFNSMISTFLLFFTAGTIWIISGHVKN